MKSKGIKMEKKYFESFDKKQIPYLYFKSKIAEKGKKKKRKMRKKVKDGI